MTEYKKPVVFVLAKGIRKQSRIFRVLICISLRQCKAQLGFAFAGSFSVASLITWAYTGSPTNSCLLPTGEQHISMA